MKRKIEEQNSSDYFDAYGNAFSLYRKDENKFEKFISYFEERFKANNLPLDIFKGKHCLDMGCGSGRGSFFMLKMGAKQVTGIDISDINIETCQLYAEAKGIKNANFIEGNLLELPFKDEEFDFVWCNGVLHHTPDPDKGLCELTRVLKTGGHSWVYLYGSGGVEWTIIDVIRDKFIENVSYSDAFHYLPLIEDSMGYISEYLDNWYTTHLKRYSEYDIAKRLKALGFRNTARLMKDVYPRVIDLSKKDLLGEQNLRFFMQKEKEVEDYNENRLPDINEKGSDFELSPQVSNTCQRIDDLYAILTEVEKADKKDSSLLRITVAKCLNQEVLKQIDNEAGFDLDSIDSKVESIRANLQAL